VPQLLQHQVYPTREISPISEWWKTVNAYTYLIGRNLMPGAKNANVWEHTSIFVKASRLSADHKCRESLLLVQWRKLSIKGVNHCLNTHVIKNVILKPTIKHSNRQKNKWDVLHHHHKWWSSPIGKKSTDKEKGKGLSTHTSVNHTFQIWPGISHPITWREHASDNTASWIRSTSHLFWRSSRKSYH